MEHPHRGFGGEVGKEGENRGGEELRQGDLRKSRAEGKIPDRQFQGHEGESHPQKTSRGGEQEPHGEGIPEELLCQQSREDPGGQIEQGEQGDGRPSEGFDDEGRDHAEDRAEAFPLGHAHGDHQGEHEIRDHAEGPEPREDRGLEQREENEESRRGQNAQKDLGIDAGDAEPGVAGDTDSVKKKHNNR